MASCARQTPTRNWSTRAMLSSPCWASPAFTCSWACSSSSRSSKRSTAVRPRRIRTPTMEAVWFVIVSSMLVAYAVLDGFDFGVGAIHRIVARTDQERRTVLAAIGPVWDGNEVWLIAAGGVLFMAFPRVYATAFSGFYLALMIVLWLLILRGVAIEFRSLQDNPLWREFWDTVFSFASILLAVVFGASLGNLVR